MQLSRIIGLLCLSTTLALAPLNIVFTDTSPAFAKGGGGGGNGGGGKGNSSSRGKAENGSNSNKSTGKTGKANTTKQAVTTKGAAKKTAAVKAPAEKKVAKKPAAQLAGLNSLKRNFHALMKTADPRMSAIAAFSTAYAQYELTNGVAPPADDPLLGDAALSAALAAATKTGTVTPEALGWAKDTLGVGTAVGTIDRMRETIAAQAVETPATETETGDTVAGSETTDPAATAETPEADTDSTEEVSGTTESDPTIDPTETSAATSTEANGL
ncbi:hypothetical protein [Rhizobium bangladeshense]|uniref:hypothetical protein n=1 Tax=Rhizobium bangladeshense TaxID=1138189 RepID=UPI001C82FE66|nr:hypothetical protein [Rhizobium bangladeshense]MBX4888858.1 hypothetical protein [Rhizobium bangladeshense]